MSEIRLSSVAFPGFWLRGAGLASRQSLKQALLAVGQIGKLVVFEFQFSSGLVAMNQTNSFNPENGARLADGSTLPRAGTLSTSPRSYVCVQAAVWGRLDEEWVSQDPDSNQHIQKLRASLLPSERQ